MGAENFKNRKKIIPVDPSNNIFDIASYDGQKDETFGFFRLEVRNDGNLYLITTLESSPLHINNNGHLILTI